jgi:hypothetical protein
MKMLRFFLIQRRWMVLRYSAKKSIKNGFENTETISRSRAKFYRDVAYFMADTVFLADVLECGNFWGAL